MSALKIHLTNTVVVFEFCDVRKVNNLVKIVCTLIMQPALSASTVVDHNTTEK